MSTPLARVLIDACLLVKGNVSNVFFDLEQRGLISLHWTPEIAKEFVKNWALKRAAADGFKAAATPQRLFANIIKTNEAKAKVRLSHFEVMQPEWRIPGWDIDSARLNLPPERFKVGEVYGVNENDYHVAAAAAVLANAFQDDVVWLASENQRHLPPSMLHHFKVWSANQGDALSALFDLAPDAVSESLLKTMRDSKKPKLSKEDMLSILSSPSHFGANKLAAKIRHSWATQHKSNTHRPDRLL